MPTSSASSSAIYYYGWFDVPNPDGTSTTWTLVHAGPNQMRAAGLSDRDFFKVGEKYTASLALARNGSPRGYVFTIKTPDEKFIYLTFGNVGSDPLNKDGKGGLRDLHTLFWIAKNALIRTGCRHQAPIPRQNHWSALETIAVS